MHTIHTAITIKEESGLESTKEGSYTVEGAHTVEGEHTGDVESRKRPFSETGFNAHTGSKGNSGNRGDRGGTGGTHYTHGTQDSLSRMINQFIYGEYSTCYRGIVRSIRM